MRDRTEMLRMSFSFTMRHPVGAQRFVFASWIAVARAKRARTGRPRAACVATIPLRLTYPPVARWSIELETFSHEALAELRR